MLRRTKRSWACGGRALDKHKTGRYLKPRLNFIEDKFLTRSVAKDFYQIARPKLINCRSFFAILWSNGKVISKPLPSRPNPWHGSSSNLTLQGYLRAYLYPPRSGRWLVGFGWGVVKTHSTKPTQPGPIQPNTCSDLFVGLYPINAGSQ